MVELKGEAASQGRTMSELVETAQRLLLRSQRKRERIPALPTFRSGGTLVDVAGARRRYQCSAAPRASSSREPYERGRGSVRPRGLFFERRGGRLTSRKSRVIYVESERYLVARRVLEELGRCSSIRFVL